MVRMFLLKKLMDQIYKTNTDMPAEEVAMAYKSLWQVERAFREMKSSLDLRPVYPGFPPTHNEVGAWTSIAS